MSCNSSTKTTWTQVWVGLTSLRSWKKADEMAIDNLHMKPKDIWDQLSNELNKIQPTWKGLTQYQEITRVQNIRSKLQGSDIVWINWRCRVSKNEEFEHIFLQFDCSIADDTKEQTTMEKIVGFGNPYLFYYMTNAENLFFYATFLIAPRPFYQCLVVIIFDKTL